MEALKIFEFQNLVAFVLPGLVATRALAYYFPALSTAYEKSTAGGEGAAVPLLVLILAALTTGLTISVLRQQFFDAFVGWCRARSPAGKLRPGWRPNYAGLLASKEKLETYERAVQNVYRYYQFICNMAFALGALAVVRWERLAGAGGHELKVTRGIGVLAVILLSAAVSQFIGWCRVHNQICRSPSRAELEEVSRAPAAPAAPASAPAAAPPSRAAAPSARAEPSGSGPT